MKSQNRNDLPKGREEEEEEPEEEEKGDDDEDDKKNIYHFFSVRSFVRSFHSFRSFQICEKSLEKLGLYVRYASAGMCKWCTFIA